jgi:hypothetical protein
VPTCAIVCLRYSSLCQHSKFRKRRLQKTGHRLHVTHAKVCMFKPDSIADLRCGLTSLSRRPFKNRHGGHPKNNTYLPRSDATI